MYTCIDAVTADIDNQKQILNKLERRRRKLKSSDIPDNCFLVVNKNRGVNRYYLGRSTDGCSVRTYINKDLTEIRHAIQERKYLDEAIARCKLNIDSMRFLLKDYKSIEPTDVVKDFPNGYKEQRNAKLLLYGFETADHWVSARENEKKEFNNRYGDYKPEGRTHTASNGESMRSKSETDIHECLSSLGIPHIYEYPMFIGGEIVRPDFLALNRRTGVNFLIEHIGFVVDPDYRIRNIKKVNRYIENGYVPNVNLILTYEDMDGNINMEAASKLFAALLK